MSWFRFADVEWDLIGDGDAVSFEGDDLLGMVGEDANVLEAEVDQDLRADSGFMLNHALASRFAVKLAARVNVNLRKFSGFFGLINAKAPSSVMEVKKDAATFPCDSFERTLNNVLAVASR